MDNGKWDLTIETLVFWLIVIGMFLLGYWIGALPR